VKIEGFTRQVAEKFSKIDKNALGWPAASQTWESRKTISQVNILDH